jgi:transposase
LRSRRRQPAKNSIRACPANTLQGFPYADITLDRFHMQQLVSDAMQELRLKHKKEAQKAQSGFLSELLGSLNFSFYFCTVKIIVKLWQDARESYAESLLKAYLD